MTCYSGSTLRDPILTGMARAFFAIAYADFVENAENPEDYDSPGPGGDWMGCLPEIPGNAWAMAGELWNAIETTNGRSMYQIAQEIETRESDPDWESFGHYLAMQAMGTGVGWSDNHPDHGLQLPYMEVSGYTFDPGAYAPR